MVKEPLASKRTWFWKSTPCSLKVYEPCAKSRRVMPSTPAVVQANRPLLASDSPGMVMFTPATSRAWSQRRPLKVHRNVTSPG